MGARIFDLGPNGVNLKIKVEKQGDYPSYVSSKFSMPTAIADLDDTKASKIYESVFELDKVFPAKSYDELKAMLNEHYYCTVVKDEVDVIDNNQPEVVTKKPTPAPAKADTNDSDIDSLLKELDATS